MSPEEVGLGPGGGICDGGATAVVKAAQIADLQIPKLFVRRAGPQGPALMNVGASLAGVDPAYRDHDVLTLAWRQPPAQVDVAQRAAIPKHADDPPDGVPW